MILPSLRCIDCKHYKPEGRYIEAKAPKGYWKEGNFVPICKAFPDGIPQDINSGENLHNKPMENQVGEFVYEKK